MGLQSLQSSSKHMIFPLTVATNAAAALYVACRHIVVMVVTQSCLDLWKNVFSSQRNVSSEDAISIDGNKECTVFIVNIMMNWYWYWSWSQCKGSNAADAPSILSPVYAQRTRLCHCWGQCFVFPSVPGHCWLGDRKGIPPVKISLTIKTTCSTYPQMFSPGTSEERKPRGNQLKHVRPENAVKTTTKSQKHTIRKELATSSYRTILSCNTNLVKHFLGMSGRQTKPGTS